MRRALLAAALWLATTLFPALAQDVGGSFSGPLGVWSGTATGTYTLGGTPTITGATLSGTTTVSGPMNYTASGGYAQATAAIAALQGAGL